MSKPHTYPIYFNTYFLFFKHYGKLKLFNYNSLVILFINV